jgi:hypothetical protein
MYLYFIGSPQQTASSKAVWHAAVQPRKQDRPRSGATQKRPASTEEKAGRF